MEHIQTEVHQITEVVATLGESPVWNVDEQALYWEDIDGKSIHRFDPETRDVETKNLPGRPGSFVFTQTPGRLLVATETALEWLDWESGVLSAFTMAEDRASGNRLNDGRCDSAGRFVVGTMYPDTDRVLSTGALYSIDGSGAVDTLETEVGVPNGLVFDAERSRMYWADTFAAKIWVWDYDIATGSRSNKQVFFDYHSRDDVHGLPDGGCLDAEGCYWSASVHGWALTRIAPDGDVVAIVDLPLAMPTMPAFGGSDLSTLYVTSINGGMVDEKRSKGVPAGAVVALDVGITGLPEPKFQR